MLHLCLSLKYCVCQLFMVDVTKFWWQFFNILHVVSLKTLTIVWHNSSSTKHWNKIHKLFSFAIFFWLLTKICQNFSTTKCKRNKLTKVWQNFCQLHFCLNFGKNLTKILSKTANFTTVSWNSDNVLSLAFFCCCQQFVYRSTTRNFSIWGLYCIFVCNFGASNIFNSLFSLFFINFPFSFYWEECWRESMGEII